jgi:hypothetical protein
MNVVVTLDNAEVDGNTSSTWDIYTNNETLDSAGSMRAPPFDGSSDLTIGTTELGSGNDLNGELVEIVIWDHYLSALEANKFNNPYFPGNTHGDGFYVESCSQTATHATCSTQKCRDGTPNACQAEGTGVMPIFGQYGDILDNNSFETVTGADSGGNFDDWTETEFAGNGTANITAYRADTKHGNISARLKTTGTTSYATLDGECIAGGSSDILVRANFKKLSGSANMFISILQYSSADCSTGFLEQTDLRAGGDVNSVWQEYPIVMDSWNGSVSSYKLRIQNYQSEADVLVDVAGIGSKIGDVTYRVPWTHLPSGDVSVSYAARNYQLHNPLADWIEEEQAYGYTDGWCISTWVYTDWDGTDTGNHFIVYVPGTAGNANRWQINLVTGSWIFLVYDSTGTGEQLSKAGTATNWAANDWKYIEACWDNAGTMAAHHYNVANGTWYNWDIPFGGAGAMAGQSSNMYIGSNAANFTDAYFSEIWVVPYAAIYPNKGFNNGRPPVNGSPY